MTITLTREEAQQVLDALADAAGCVQENYQPGHMGHGWGKEIETLRARLEQPECVCGEPDTAGVHRQDGPCYQQPDSELKLISTGVTHIYSTGAPDAIQYDKDGNEMAHWKFRSFLPAPEPEPVGWIYEDDEGRMMFSQMPTSALFWEPVYRNQIKGKPISSRTHTPEDIKKIQERWEETVAGGLVRFRDSWVGLTDEEILAFVVHKEDRSLLRFARAIEEALREKNS
jgi:hypothetical protein